MSAPVETVRRRIGLIDQYIALQNRAIANASEKLQKHDIDPALELAHQLRGSGTMFGFPSVSELGQSLQDLLERGRTRQAAACLSKIADTLNHSRDVAR